MKKEEFTVKILDAEKTLYHIEKSILKKDEDCADAIQNAIITAFYKLNTLKREAFFQTWLTRILINECCQMLRNKKEEVSYEEYLEKQDTYEIDNTSELYQAINELEEKYRIPFILYYAEGFYISKSNFFSHQIKCSYFFYPSYFILVFPKILLTNLYFYVYLCKTKVFL